MNRNTKLVLLVSLFGLVCLAILWGRWFPDNRRGDTETVRLEEEGDQAPPAYADAGVAPRSETREIWVGPGLNGAPSPAGGLAAPAPGRLGLAAPMNLGNPSLAPSASPLAAPPARDVSGPANGDGPGWTSYTVKDGDALWKISQRYLGDGNRYKEIESANPGLDASKLKAGRVLRIPPKERGGSDRSAPASEPRRGAEPAEAPSSGSTGTHVIQDGDSLWGLAARYLKSGARWEEIAKLNGLNENSVLSNGKVLKIPAR